MGPCARRCGNLYKCVSASMHRSTRFIFIIHFSPDAALVGPRIGITQQFGIPSE